MTMRPDPVKQVLKEEARTWSRVAAVIILVAMAQGVWAVYLQPSPAFRAMVGMQAYDTVKPVIVSFDDSALTLRGTFIKRRCVFDRISAYVTGVEGYEQAWLDRSVETARRPTGDRPISDTPQAWGPWTIRHFGPPAMNWEIVTVHDCPEGSQTNVFASGDWPKTEGVTP